MLNAIKHMAFILCFVLTLGSVCYSPQCFAGNLEIEQATDTPDKCSGAYTNNSPDNGTTPDASGMFADEILSGMNLFMKKVHKTLSKPLMIGHSLMCYASDVAYTCVGDGFCLFKFYNLKFFISGLIIYGVGILMAMSIGMYFVDISFKLGFAVLFMPISIALWPFPPTKNKFSDNLSIIIKNAMLFTLVAIGVSFAITLINSSLFDGKHGMSGEQDFWTAIATSNTELLTQNFAFDDFHFIIIGFGLLFGFKILASSVNDYLNYFFSDSIFGSESPMHRMGTQAIGMVTANTITPAISFAKDVAKTQTGRAISGIGGGIAALATKDGRKEIAGNIKKGYQSAKNVVTHPRATFNSAVTSLEDTAKKAAASGIKGVFNSASLLLPVKESTRRNWEKGADAWIDNNIAEGKLRNLAADTAAAGANIYNQMTGNKNAKFVTRDDVKEKIEETLDSVKNDLKTLKNNGIKENAKQGIVKAATMAHNLKEAATGSADNMISEEDMRERLHDVKEDINDKYVKPITETAKIYAEPITEPLKKGTQKVTQRVQREVNEFKQDAHDLGEGIIDKASKAAKSKLAQELADAWRESDKAPITLQPSALISAPFKAVRSTAKGLRHPIDSAVENIEKLASGWEKLQKEKEADSKIIWKKGGRLVLRTAARTIKGTGEETASVLGNALKNFGQSLQQNGGNSKKGWTSWKEVHAEEEAKKEAAQEDKNFYNSLADKYDE